MGMVCLMVTMMGVDIMCSGESEGWNTVPFSEYNGNEHCNLSDATSIWWPLFLLF